MNTPATPQARQQWAPRDASWYSRPSTGGVPRWHIVGAGGAAACGRVPMLDTSQAAPSAPSEAMRCKRCAG